MLECEQHRTRLLGYDAKESLVLSPQRFDFRHKLYAGQTHLQIDFANRVIPQMQDRVIPSNSRQKSVKRYATTHFLSALGCVPVL